MPGEGTQQWLGWKLDREDREDLLARFLPRYARTIGDHVTFGPAGDSPPLPGIESAKIVGRADDREGVEALVVALDEDTGGWDGSTYHITWSLAEGREAVQSNRVIADHGWSEVSDGPNVALSRACWP